MTNLLILGGTPASRDIVTVAKRMGIHTIVTDDGEVDSRISKQIADGHEMVSTTDIDGLKRLIRKKKIDGVFCGPSEFNIYNAMLICQEAGLPFYCTREQWDICSDKKRFKELCRLNGVPCVLEYDVKRLAQAIEYPVIVKPADSCSSQGITVCENWEELTHAYKEAERFSDNQEVIVERYIQNQGVGVSVRYIVVDGAFHLSLMGDRYVTDPYEKKALTTNLVIYPSVYTESYQNKVDQKVQRMFKHIGITNGVLFMQALPENGEIYFHEMGLRLSGGLPYVITEAANGINDVEMMIRYAVGEEMCTDQEISRIDPYLHGRHAALFSVPIKPGIIGTVEGIDEIKSEVSLLEYTQYYEAGNEIMDSHVGTTMQFLCRFKFFAENRADIINKIKKIQKRFKVTDVHGKDMIYKYFDCSRITG